MSINATAIHFARIAKRVKQEQAEFLNLSWHIDLWKRLVMEGNDNAAAKAGLVPPPSAPGKTEAQEQKALEDLNNRLKVRYLSMTGGIVANAASERFYRPDFIDKVR